MLEWFMYSRESLSDFYIDGMIYVLMCECLNDFYTDVWMHEWFLYWCVNAWVIIVLMCECLSDYCTNVWMLGWFIYWFVNILVISVPIYECLSDFCTDVWMLEQWLQLVDHSVHILMLCCLFVCFFLKSRIAQREGRILSTLCAHNHEESQPWVYPHVCPKRWASRAWTTTRPWLAIRSGLNLAAGPTRGCCTAQQGSCCGSCRVRQPWVVSHIWSLMRWVLRFSLTY